MQQVPARTRELDVRRNDHRALSTSTKISSCPYLKFGGYEHGSGADQLQHLPVDWSLGQVVVRHLYGQVEGLVVQLKVLLNKQTDGGGVFQRQTALQVKFSRRFAVNYFLIDCKSQNTL